MALQFGVFDHIEPVPGLSLDRIYRERLLQIDRLDTAGFYAYHLAEHHTPAIHSLAPSQNVFLASVAQRTTRLRFGPCVYMLPLQHPRITQRLLLRHETLPVPAAFRGILSASIQQ